MKRKVNRVITMILVIATIMCTMLVCVTAAVKPATPKTATENAVDGILVKWNKVDGAVKYNVYRRQAGSNAWCIVGTSTGTSLLDKGVTSGIYYMYSVRAYNNAGQYSDYVAANTQNRKYMAVPKLTSISNATDGLYIKWNAVAGVTNGYRVYRRGAGSTYWSYLGTTKNLYYTDTAVKNNSGEYFRYTVIADGGYHSKFDITGLYLRRLANPSSIKVAILLDGVSVTWGAVKGSLSYNVYRRAAGQSNWTLLANVKTTSYKDIDVANNQFYKYTVRAVSGSTLSYFNDGALTRYMQAPVINGHTSTASNVTIKWNAVTGATAYRVYRRGSGEGWKLVATVSATSYTDKNVIKNAYYRYTIRSVSGSYVSGYDDNGYLLKFTATANTTAGNDILNNPLSAYQKAANAIHERGIAGYNKKNWQHIDDQFDVQSSNSQLNGDLSRLYTDLLRDFMTTEEEAEVKVNAKGSDDAKNRMPYSLCSSSCVKSATAVRSGSNYVVTIVMRDQVNPSYRDSDGIGVMSRDFLDYKDVVSTVENDQTVSKVVRDLDGTINYKDYTIVATMNEKGQFINIKHYGVAYLNADLDSVGWGSIDIRGTTSFYSVYSDFVY